MMAKVKLALVALLAMVLVFSLGGFAAAGQYSALDAKISAAKAKEAAINKKQIEYRAAMQQGRVEITQYDSMEKAMAARAAIVASNSKKANDKWMAPFKMTVFLPFTVGYTAFQGLTHPTSSPLEILVFPSIFRGFNSAVSHVIQTEVGGAVDIASLPFTAETYAPPVGKIGWLAKRTMSYYPLTQVGVAAATLVPTTLLATGALSGIEGVSQAGSMAIYGASGSTVGLGLGEGLNYLEMKAFGK